MADFFVITNDNLAEQESRLYGFCVEGDGIYTGEDVCMSRYPSGNGCFVWIRADADSVEIRQDDVGCFGLYLYQDGESFALSNSFFELADWLKCRKRLVLNKQYMRHFIVMDLCSLATDETAISNIRLLNGSARVLIDKHSHRLHVIDDPQSLWDVPLTSKAGMRILDEWCSRWMKIMRGLSNRTDSIRLNLSGGIDSRLVLMLALRAGVRLDRINVHSFQTNSPVHQEDYRIASAIAKRFGFPLNQNAKPNELWFSLDDRCYIGEKAKLGFHSKMYIPTGRQKGNAYQFPGAGGELLRDYWMLSEKELIEKYVAIVRRRFPEGQLDDYVAAVRNVLSKSCRSAATKYNLDCDLSGLGNAVYRETRCRNHFGRTVLESYLGGNFMLTPLLDRELRRLKLDDPKCEDKNLLIAVMFARFMPELLEFPFEGGRTIDEHTKEYARRIISEHPCQACVKFDTFHLPAENLHGFDYQTSAPTRGNRDLEDMFYRAVASQDFKQTVIRYLGRPAYRLLTRNIEPSAGFSPTNNLHRAIAVFHACRVVLSSEMLHSSFVDGICVAAEHIANRAQLGIKAGHPILLRHGEADGWTYLDVCSCDAVCVRGNLSSPVLESDSNKAGIFLVKCFNSTGEEIRSSQLAWSKMLSCTYRYLALGTFSVNLDLPEGTQRLSISIRTWQSSQLELSDLEILCS